MGKALPRLTWSGVIPIGAWVRTRFSPPMLVVCNYQQEKHGYVVVAYKEDNGRIIETTVETKFIVEWQTYIDPPPRRTA